MPRWLDGNMGSVVVTAEGNDDTAQIIATQGVCL